MQMAADMAAAGGIEVQRALVVPVGRDLRKTLPYDRPVPALKFIQGGDFTRGDILCKALQRPVFSVMKFFAALSGTRPGA